MSRGAGRRVAEPRTDELHVTGNTVWPLASDRMDIIYVWGGQSHGPGEVGRETLHKTTQRSATVTVSINDVILMTSTATALAAG